MQAFPRGAWEREQILQDVPRPATGLSRSHALRGNACPDAPRPATKIF